MIRNGSSARMRSHARLRSSGFSKSHFTPAASAWRSKVEPATSPLLAGRACVTRGGEYSSATAAGPTLITASPLASTKRS